MTQTELPNGLVETLGTGTTADAANRLIAAIEKNENLGLAARFDHAANAESVGLELTPTVEILFGSPAQGTPLMHIAPTVAIDLPQKMLIIQTSDGVRVLHNDPTYLAERHGIPMDTPQISAAVVALQKLANVAAGI